MCLLTTSTASHWFRVYVWYIRAMLEARALVVDWRSLGAIDSLPLLVIESIAITQLIRGDNPGVYPRVYFRNIIS